MRRASRYVTPPYDPVRHFAPIAYIRYISQVVVVTPSLDVNSVKGVIEGARAQPGTLNYASSGKGTAAHWQGLIAPPARHPPSSST